MTRRNTQNEQEKLLARSLRLGRGRWRRHVVPVEEALRMRDDGLSFDAIGSALGFGRNTVVAALRAEGHSVSKRKGSGDPDFWPLVVKTNTCWIWTGSTDPKGYGIARVNGMSHRAHRYVYAALVEEIRPGMVIDHRCGNPRCVNPEHLRQVSNAENTQFGKRAKMDADKVRAMRHEYARGLWTQEALAKRYGLHVETVRGILLKRSWANV